MYSTKNEEITNNEEELLYELGEPTSSEASKKEDDSVVKIEDYPVSAINNRLKIKSLRDDEWKTDKTIDENPLNYGLIMHRILQELTRRRRRKTHPELIFSGQISEEESHFVKDTMEKFWQLPSIDSGFQSGKTLNEATILLSWR